MRRIRYFLIVVVFLLQNSFLLHAQTTEGKEFWVTFGQMMSSSMNPNNVDNFDFHIRIIGGSDSTSGTIYFTNLKTSIHFEIAPYEIYNYSLDSAQKLAVYTTVTGVTDFSIRITASNPVSVYASKTNPANYVDITNLLPVTVFGTDYYAISYNTSSSNREAYSVVATQNNTQLYHNGDSVATLNAGEVYYRTSNVDMTGAFITSNRPVAFFAQNKGTAVYPYGTSDILFQQLAPVHTWGKTFFVPVTVIGTERVRIVVSQDSTTITRTGGTIITNTGGQPTLENLQAGQFVELEISLSDNGCFIYADKPIGVCSYMISYHFTWNPTGTCSQVWIPPIEQSVSNVLTAPFIYPNLVSHYALVVTPTDTKDNTRVAIGEWGIPVPLSGGGSWYANEAAGMSFYNFPFTNFSASYRFSNPAKIIVLGYGTGNNINVTKSYYYLAGSAMRNLSAAFTANDIPYNKLSEHIFCEHDITFVANVEGIHQDVGSLKWYINEGEQYTKRDSLEWSKNFETGNYEIKMEVRFENDSIKTYQDTLRIANCGAAFYANNIHHANLPHTTICTKDVNFRAEIEGLHPDTESLKWFIDGKDAGNEMEWSEVFTNGTYNIEMRVRFANGEEETISSTLKVEVFWIKMRNVRY